MATNDEQAAALASALAPMIAAAILPQITEHVEGQIKGLKDKSAELLDKLHNVTKDKEIADKIAAGDALAAKTKTLLDGLPKKPDGLTDFRKVGEPVRISRSDARDVGLYRKAKELAAEQKVSLEIVADD